MNVYAPSPTIQREWPMFHFVGKRITYGGKTFMKCKVKSRDNCINFRIYVYCFELNAVSTDIKSFDIL